ncbi:prolyl aminopeptidase [Candidatus Dojkabacteria bacterium]|nr:prolyl aminopeptidase [Candidatus Dojkabacteria bacterium]
MKKYSLFAQKEPYKTHRLKVSKIHTLYVEESGNPKGKPIIHLHGGPGAWAKPKNRKFYNPKKYRIILFDQRGCGRSTPQGEIRENTIWNLVEDMEKIRESLGIEKWHIHGGSWGSTLALAYTEKYPKRATALILRGVFTFRKKELNWFNNFGASEIFPDAWEKLVKATPKKYRDNPMDYLIKRVLKGTGKEKLKYSKAISEWEDSIMQLLPEENKKEEETDNKEIVNSNLVYAHYDINRGFLKEGQLIKNASKLKGIPGVIIQGRYDIICPVRTAWDLHKAWPEADFHIVPVAGHSSADSGITEKLLEYIEKFSRI